MRHSLNTMRPRKRPLAPDDREWLASFVREHGELGAVALLGWSRLTLARAIAGFDLYEVSHAAMRDARVRFADAA